MSKKTFMARIKRGRQKEIEVSGEKFVVKAPELYKYGTIVKMQTQLEKGKEIDFSLMAKIVIDNTFDVESGNAYFSAGDFEALKNDRDGAVKKIAEEIISLMVPTEDEKEETKKK